MGWPVPSYSAHPNPASSFLPPHPCFSYCPHCGFLHISLPFPSVSNHFLFSSLLFNTNPYLSLLPLTLTISLSLVTFFYLSISPSSTHHPCLIRQGFLHVQLSHISLALFWGSFHQPVFSLRPCTPIDPKGSSLINGPFCGFYVDGHTQDVLRWESALPAQPSHTDY